MIKFKINSTKKILKEDKDQQQQKKPVNPLLAQFQNPDDLLLLKQLPKDAILNPIVKTFLKAGYIPVIGANLNPVMYGSGDQGMVMEVVKDGKRYAGKVSHFENEKGFDPLDEKDIRKSIETIRSSLPPEVSKHIIKTHAIFNDKDNLYFIMDIVRPMRTQETEALYYGTSETQAIKTKRNLYMKGWHPEKDPLEDPDHIYADLPDEPVFNYSYHPIRTSTIEKGNEKQKSFMLAMKYLAEKHGIYYGDLHQDNVMINPKTGDYVATDIGLFYTSAPALGSGDSTKDERPNAPEQEVDGEEGFLWNKLIAAQRNREKKTVKENKTLLQEMSLEQARTVLHSKATKKLIFSKLWEYNKWDLEDNGMAAEKSWNEEQIKEYLKRITEKQMEYIYPNFISVVPLMFPDDIEEDEKALSIVWLKRVVAESIYAFINIKEVENLLRHFFGNFNVMQNLERYFQWKRFIEPAEMRDINRVPGFIELGKLIKDAEPRFKEWQAQQAYADAEQGTEVIYEDEKWKIFIPHNRGAACELGKNTSWCTAAPGTDQDYYAHYHKEDDPLFVVWQKARTKWERDILKDNPKLGEAYNKFQFHYGSGQFMDNNDDPISLKSEGATLFKEIHKILMNTVGDRFPFLKENIIETDIGFSRKDSETDQDQYTYHGEPTEIAYKDILTGRSYGGEFPTIRIRHDDPGSWDEPPLWVATYDFNWQQITDQYDATDQVSFRGPEEGASDHPSYLKIQEFYDPKTKTLESTHLRIAKWYNEGNYIAGYNWDSGLNLAFQKTDTDTAMEFYKNIWDQIYKEQYETRILNQEEKFAKDILDHFLPNRWTKLNLKSKEEKKDLKESRQLLNEITIEQAKATIFSKATAKRVFLLRKEMSDNDEWSRNYFAERTYDGEDNQHYVQWFWDYISKAIPQDISEKQKAMSIIWLKNIGLSNSEMCRTFIKREKGPWFRTNIERYWQMHDFVSQKDINRIKNSQELKSIIDEARAKYQAWQEKQHSKDAEIGTEFIGEDNEYKVYIAHNKGAACELGKGTDWCTAAPGLDYFEQYYKPTDPLFIFISKTATVYVIKFQFHYGTQQFMNAEDTPVTNRKFRELHALLMNLLEQKGQLEKYPVVAEYDRKYQLGLGAMGMGND
jgi:hypothetical protein